MGDLKRLAVLGSTGSIGQQTLQVVRALPNQFRVIGLAAADNIDLFQQQITEFKPDFIYFRAEEPRLANVSSQFLALDNIAALPEVDMVVVATSGKAGLSPTLAAVRAGKNVALSNKESLVMAGEIITAEAKQSGAQILPVDSEHSAIWQCLRGESQKAARIMLTASGGPFLYYTPEQLNEVTVEQALAHPSWKMGRKVTIDSATLMNKGLEVIEAHWLFDMPYEHIDILIHPQSIIHSMVEFADSSIKAQLGYPDMRLPIQYALTYPERMPNPELPGVDWSQIKSLTFEKPDFDAFPCLKLAIEAGKKDGTFPAVLCAADEVAVELFLSWRLKFSEIAQLVGQVLSQHQPIAHPTLAEIIKADGWARERLNQLAGGE
ncbi:MAG: 1-deoxy-D-xylulose-5-phosphate reductoisomerase [Dehalococcoidia bacterium]|nr:MAG: 1-deoxy-D-xylulose-5-phosphate reductoisomerase [Dehalococcoidia bacterium]